MPGYDGKGPDGKGSMTGRRRGYCAGNKKEDTESQEQDPQRRFYGRPDSKEVSDKSVEENRGLGRGSGRGLGRRFRRGR